MAGLLGKLNVKVDGDTAEFNRAMDKGASKAQATMQSIQRSVRRAGPIIGAALVTAAAGFTVALKKTIDQADEFSKLSQKIGISVQSLSAFKLAAELAGTNFETLTKSIGRFARNISDASNALSTPLRAFEALDIAFENSDGSLRKVEDTLLDVADKFSMMEDGTKKAALAAELFGRGGFELIPFLNQGRDGIAAVTAEAEKLGIVFNTKTARAAEEFNDNLTRMKAAAQGIFISISNDLLPTMVDLSDEIVNNQGKVTGLTKNTNTLTNSFITVISAAKLVKAGFIEIGNAVGDTAAVIGVLSGNGTTSGAFSGPLINAIRFRKELKSIVNKSNSDRGQALKEANDEIEQLWIKHWARQKETAEKGGDDVNAASKAGAIGRSKDFVAALKEGEALTTSLRNPLEVFADTTERLDSLLAQGAISQETFTRAQEKAKATYEKNTLSLTKQGSALKDLGTTFASGFEQAIVDGKKFSEVLKELEKDIIRIIVRKQILDPLLGALFGGGGGGGGGLFGTLFNANGNAFSNGNVTTFGKGGVFGGPTAFGMKNGGIGVAGEAGDEGILPLMRNSNGKLGVIASGGGGVQVNVYAPAGSKVRTDSSQDGGMEQLNIFIDEATAQNIRGGTKTFDALQATFGLDQQVISR